jgi:hypothetical protein
VRTKGLKSGHLSKSSWVIQLIHGLLNCEIEWHVVGKDVKIIVIDSGHFHWWVWAGVDFLCKFLLSLSLHPHFKWDAMEHSIMDVGALEVPTLMSDSVS